MTDFRERYKRLGYGREDVEVNRALRSQRRDQARRDERSEQHSLWRKIEHADDTLEREDAEAARQEQEKEEDKKKAESELEVAVQKRLLQLEQWKEERNRKKIQEKKKAKPVFKVGVVHHRVYSPPLNKDPVPLPPPKLCKTKACVHPEPISKKVTKATEKRLAAKAVTDQQKRENLRSKKKDKIEVSAKDKVQFAPKDHQFKAPVGIEPIPMFGRQAMAVKENLQLEPSDSNELSVNPLVSSSSLESKNNSVILSKSSDRLSRRSTRSKINNLSINEEANDIITKGGEEEEISFSSKKINVSVDSSSLKPSKESSMISTSIPKLQFSDASDTVDHDLLKNVTKSRPSRTSTRKLTVQKDFSLPLDQEMICSQENENVNNKTKSPEKKVSVSMNIDEDQEMLDKHHESRTIRENISFSIDISMSKPSEDEKKPIEAISSENQEVDNQSENMDAFLSEKDLKKSSIDSKKFQEVSNRNHSIVKEVSITLDDQEIFSNRVMNLSVEKNKKKRQARSVKKLPQENTCEALINEHNNEHENINSSFLNQNKSKSDKRKSVVPYTEVQDQSLIKFSPRISTRLQSKDSPKQNDIKVNQNQFLEKISSTISEMTKQNVSNKLENSINEVNLNISIPKNIEKPPALFSPYIVSSRGKSSVRKEIQRRLSQPAPMEIPTKDTVMQNLNISVEEEELTAQYYKYILDKEIERLNEVCNKWNEIKDSDEVPEDTSYIIQAAIGQTQLLINKKFQRFRGLVLDCETGKGEMLVTCKDLQGFWEMMYMEIKDCDSRFNKLEEMKMRNWVEIDEEETKEQPKKKAIAARKPIAAKKKSAAPKSSSLRAHIMAARKKKMGNNEGEIDIKIKEEMDLEQSERLQSTDESKNIQSETPVKNIRQASTPKSTSKWQSLLQKVQLSQTRKSTTSPLIVMKLSQMCKSPQVQLDDSIVYINSDRTPAKSILKHCKEDVLVPTSSKTANKVFFKEEVTEFENNSVTESTTNMGLDNAEKEKRPIERILNFEDDSFNASHVEDKEKEDSNTASQTVSLSPFNAHLPKIMINGSSPMISMSPLTLDEKNNENSAIKKNTRKTKKQISFKNDINGSYSRKLRSATFSAPLTPGAKRNSKKDEDSNMEVDDSMQDSMQTENDLLHNPVQNQNMELYLNAEGIICERSLPQKKTTPRTSRVKRSNSARSEKKNLIDLDKTNEKPSTPRLRRKAENVPEIRITECFSPVENSKSMKLPETPKVTRQSLKRTFADSTTNDVNMDEATPPKLSRRTSKANNSSKHNIDDFNESTKEPTTPIVRNKRNSKKNTSIVGTPSLRRKSSKTSQENIEPNKQETEQDKIGRRKSSRVTRISIRSED